MTMLLILAGLLQAHPFSAALAGSWTGTLEYRDYRSDRRVTLPTTLAVAAGAGNELTFSYVYDDGPGKTVRSTDRVTIDAAARSYRIQNADGTYDAIFAASGLGEFGPASRTVVLTGKGDENGVVVDLRTTITVDDTSLTMRRESRRAGEDWLFRNEYRLTREARVP